MGEEMKQVPLEFLCRYERTAEVCRAAIEEDGWQLENVPEEMKTPELCRRALDTGADLGNEHLGLLHYIPFPDVCLDVLKECHTGGMTNIYEVATAIRPEVMNDAIADYLLPIDGICLSILPVHLQTPERVKLAVETSGTFAIERGGVMKSLLTPEVYVGCAAHSWQSFAMIPWAERSPEVCLMAKTLYPEMLEKRPELVPENVKNGCNVYSLGKLMEQATGEKFSFGQIKEFYEGKPMAVKRMEIPEGILINREVTFDKQNEKFRFAPLRQREEQAQGKQQKEEHKPQQSQGEEHTQGRERKKGLKL